MDLMDVLSNGGLVIGGAGLAKIADMAMKAWSTRNQRTEISPNPFGVTIADRNQTLESCRANMAQNTVEHADLFKRVAVIEQRTAMLDERTLGMLSQLKAIGEDIKQLLKRR